jgi:hypothetical protein
VYVGAIVTIAGQARCEEESGTLLLVRMGPYVEADISDFLRFHREVGTPLTQVHHSQGPLDLVAVDGKQLRNAEHSFRASLSAMIGERQEYRFNGYVNALADPADFRRLVEDGLRGRCAIRPIGNEVTPGTGGAAISRAPDSRRRPLASARSRDHTGGSPLSCPLRRRMTLTS